MIKLLAFTFLFAILLSWKPADKTIIATVDYSFSGCFSSGKGKLVLFKNGDITTAELTTTDQQKFTTLLTQPQIEVFKRFVQELKITDFSYGCTTQYEYVVHFENEVIKKTDGSCNWDGFSKLRKQLFNSSY